MIPAKSRQKRILLRMVVLAAFSTLLTGAIWHLSRPQLVIEWDGEPSAASVYLNQKPVGAVSERPVSLVCPPGIHQIRLESNGFEDVRLNTAYLSRFSGQTINCQWKKTPQRVFREQTERLVASFSNRSMPKPSDRIATRRAAILLMRQMNSKSNLDSYSMLQDLLRASPIVARKVNQTQCRELWKIGNDRLRHSGAVRDLLFTPDGTKLVSCGDDGRVAVFRSKDGSRLWNLDGHNSGVTSLAISTDSSSLFSGDYAGTIKKWNLHDPRGKTFAQLRGQIRSLDVHPTTNRMAVGFAEKTSVLDTATADTVRTLDCDTFVTCARFSPNGNWVAIGCDDGSVLLCDSVQLAPIHEFSTNRSIEHVYFSPDSKRVTAVGEQRSTTWKVSNGEVVFEYKTAPRVLNFGKGGEWVAERRKVSRAHEVRIKRNENTSLHEIGSNFPQKVAIHGDRVAIGTLGGSILLRRFGTDDVLAAPQSIIGELARSCPGSIR